MTDSEKVWLEQNHQVVVRVLCTQLSRDNQPRQDYLEFIKLSLVALDEASRISDGNSIHFSPPGAYHLCQVDGKEPEDTSLQRAVQDECQRTASSEKDLPSPCVVKAWLPAPVTCDALTSVHATEFGSISEH